MKSDFFAKSILMLAICTALPAISLCQVKARLQNEKTFRIDVANEVFDEPQKVTLWFYKDEKAPATADPIAVFTRHGVSLKDGLGTQRIGELDKDDSGTLARDTIFLEKTVWYETQIEGRGKSPRRQLEFVTGSSESEDDKPEKLPTTFRVEPSLFTAFSPLDSPNFYTTKLRDSLGSPIVRDGKEVRQIVRSPADRSAIFGGALLAQTIITRMDLPFGGGGSWLGFTVGTPLTGSDLFSDSFLVGPTIFLGPNRNKPSQADTAITIGALFRRINVLGPGLRIGDETFEENVATNRVWRTGLIIAISYKFSGGK